MRERRRRTRPRRHILVTACALPLPKNGIFAADRGNFPEMPLLRLYRRKPAYKSLPDNVEKLRSSPF